MNASLTATAANGLPTRILPAQNAPRARRLRAGFTLVEIMIVVVIIGLLAAMAVPAFAKVRQQSRVKAVVTNLRQLASASQEYMLEKGATQAGYTDLVGTGTDFYIHGISPVVGESYTGITFVTTTTQISLSNSALGTVTYNL